MNDLRVFAKGNLFYVVDNVTKVEDTCYVSEARVDRKLDTDNVFNISTKNESYQSVSLSQILDESGVAYGSLALFKTFYESNTGATEKLILDNEILSVKFGDSESLDAFGKLKTSSSRSLFDSQSQYNNAPLQMESGATGTGVVPAHNTNTRMVQLSCTAGTGTSFYQSYQYTPYFPGDSHEPLWTFVFGSGVAGAVVDVGYFDASNGIILRQNGVTNLQVILRTSTSGSVSNANIANQADWNIDGMNSSLNSKNPSGKTFDVTKGQIGGVNLQFLAMGRVRVTLNINGITYDIHEFNNANNLAVPYMQTATLPIQMLITATSTVATKTCHFKCGTIHTSNTGVDFSGFAFSTPEMTVTAASGSRTHIGSIRPKTTFNSITNRTNHKCCV